MYNNIIMYYHVSLQMSNGRLKFRDYMKFVKDLKCYENMKLHNNPQVNENYSIDWGGVPRLNRLLFLNRLGKGRILISAILFTLGPFKHRISINCQILFFKFTLI